MSATITDPEKIDLLRRALVHITEHPDEWDQGMWLPEGVGPKCGTACCIAGHIALMTGWSPIPIDPDSAWFRTLVVERDGAEGDVDEVAAEAIGVSDPDVDQLFRPSNTLDELWRIAAELTGGAITRPEVTA